MALDSDQAAVDLSPIASFSPTTLAANVRLQRPLSRRGNGPGLMIFLAGPYSSPKVPAKCLDPEPLQKWAEEGFAVVEVMIGTVESIPNQRLQVACDRGIAALKALPECTPDERIGVVGMSRPRDASEKYYIYASTTKSAHHSFSIPTITCTAANGRHD